MTIETFIELYEKGQITEEVVEQMQHFAFMLTMMKFS